MAKILGVSPACSAANRRIARTRGAVLNHRGELGEVAFLHKAVSLGFTVAKPYGHVHRYDLIVEAGRYLWRVQVKACATLNNGLYHVCSRRRTNSCSVAYKEHEIDFLAAYIVPEDAWFIVPEREVVGHRSLLFRPEGFPRRDLYGHYREAWHLFRQPDGLVFG